MTREGSVDPSRFTAATPPQRQEPEAFCPPKPPICPFAFFGRVRRGICFFFVFCWRLGGEARRQVSQSKIKIDGREVESETAG